MTTTRDDKVLKVVRDHVVAKGYPPSVREIAKKLGLKSTSGVHASLVRLRKAKLVAWEDGHPRTLRPTG